MENTQIFTLFGIPFNVSNCLSSLLAAIIILGLVYWLSRDIKIKPTGKQNVLEWMMDFTNGIIKSTLPDAEGKKYGLLAFTLFLFVFISSQIGLMLIVFRKFYNSMDFSN